jgi:hypothetical protein
MIALNPQQQALAGAFLLLIGLSLGFIIGREARTAEAPAKRESTELPHLHGSRSATPPSAFAAQSKAEENHANSTAAVKAQTRSSEGEADEPVDLPTILAMPAGSARSRELDRAIDRLAKSSPAEAVRAVEALPASSSRNELMNRVLRTWSEQDPAAAKAYVLGLDEGPLRLQAVRTLSTQIVHTDPGGAYTLLDELPSESERNHARMDLGIEWAQKDPRRAGAYLVEHGEKWDHDHTLIHVVSHWSYRDAPGALDWISSLRRAKYRESFSARSWETMRAATRSPRRSSCKGSRRHSGRGSPLPSQAHGLRSILPPPRGGLPRCQMRPSAMKQ